MKLIVAIIRPDRLNEVLEALYRAEVRGLTVSRVLGHGGETDQVETYRAPPSKWSSRRRSGSRSGSPSRSSTSP